MGQFEEANSRLFKNIFICKLCKSKIRAPGMKVLQGKIVCRHCNNAKLRPKRKK